MAAEDNKVVDLLAALEASVAAAKDVPSTPSHRPGRRGRSSEDDEPAAEKPAAKSAAKSVRSRSRRSA